MSSYKIEITKRPVMSFYFNRILRHQHNKITMWTICMISYIKHVVSKILQLMKCIINRRKKLLFNGSRKYCKYILKLVECLTVPVFIVLRLNNYTWINLTSNVKLRTKWEQTKQQQNKKYKMILKSAYF
jgi:hypothetical protein